MYKLKNFLEKFWRGFIYRTIKKGIFHKIVKFASSILPLHQLPYLFLTKIVILPILSILPKTYGHVWMYINYYFCCCFKYWILHKYIKQCIAFSSWYALFVAIEFIIFIPKKYLFLLDLIIENMQLFCECSYLNAYKNIYQAFHK